jgi:hypothetical protein
MKNGFVRAICRFGATQPDCHSGRIGFVRAVSTPDNSVDCEGFMKNGFVRALSLGRGQGILATLDPIMLACMKGIVIE